MFYKVLIANRGEIAVRAIKTFKKMGIKSVVVYSDPDINSMHVTMSDIAIHLPGAKSVDTYLDIPKIIAACVKSGAEAVFPGYGFLSENPEFAQACEENGITFIGPTASQIEDFGLKHKARELAIAAGVPITKGSGKIERKNVSI
jgi:urea carboxylase